MARCLGDVRGRMRIDLVAGMSLGTSVEERELPSMLERFVRIVEWGQWSDRLDWLEREVRRDSGMQLFWWERCGLELAFSSVWRRYRTRRRLSSVDSMAAEELRFLGFATSLVHCYEGLSGGGKKRLKGMLRDATNRDHGLGPLAHEMFIATHLAGRGYEVGFHDLESGSGFDLLASKDGVRVQVECKHISGDIGRQIHRKDLYGLADRVSPRMLSHLGNLNTGLFVRLTLPGRLHSREDVQKGLCALLGRAMVSGLGRSEEHECRVDVQEFNVSRVAVGWASAGGVDRGRIAAALARHFGLVNKNVLVYVQPGKSAIVVAVESQVEDRVLAAIHRMLRESSKKQFDSGLPAILCCHLAEVTEEQLGGLRDKGERGIGLDYMTSDLLNRRPNLHSVTYTGQGRVREKLVGKGPKVQRSIGETGPTYTIKNGHHAMAGDQRLSAFEEGWPYYAA